MVLGKSSVDLSAFTMSKLAACRSGISLKHVELDKRCTSLHLSRCYLALAELPPYRGKRWCWNWMRHFESRRWRMRCCCAEWWPVDYWFLSRTQKRLLFYEWQRLVDNCSVTFCHVTLRETVRWGLQAPVPIEAWSDPQPTWSSPRLRDGEFPKFDHSWPETSPRKSWSPNDSG